MTGIPPVQDVLTEGRSAQDVVNMGDLRAWRIHHGR